MLYIKFRKKFILPIRYFLEGRRIVKASKSRDSAVVLERIAKLKAELVKETKYERRAEMGLLKARISELEWTIYADTTKEESTD